MRNSPYTHEIRHGVLDLEAGISWQFKNCNLNIYAATSSTEVRAQTFKIQNQRFGGVRLAGANCVKPVGIAILAWFLRA